MELLYNVHETALIRNFDVKLLKRFKIAETKAMDLLWR